MGRRASRISCPALTVTGTPISFTTAVGFAWIIPDASILNTSPSRSEVLAVGVPSGATFYASPDLLPGETLSIASSTLSLVNDSTVPLVGGSQPGSVLDTISDRDHYIEVMDADQATARILRTASCSGPGNLARIATSSTR
jgi:hypothetical protein